MSFPRKARFLRTHVFSPQHPKRSVPALMKHARVYEPAAPFDELSLVRLVIPPEK